MIYSDDKTEKPPMGDITSDDCIRLSGLAVACTDEMNNDVITLVRGNDGSLKPIIERIGG